MSWPQALHQRFNPTKGIDATKSTLRRLVGRPHQDRYLRSEPMDGKRVCYYLTNRTVQLLGFPHHRSASLGRIALMRCYAQQWFFELDGRESRWPCSPQNHPDLFPVQEQKLPRANFYLEEHLGKTELGFAVTDFGSDPRRIARRAIDLLDRFLDHGWFDEFLAADSFAVTFLTMTDEKSRAIAKHFEQGCRRRLAERMSRIGGSQPAGVHADYRVVPGLIDLLPSPSSGDFQ